MDNLKERAARVKAERERRGWSQSDLAGRARSFALEAGFDIKLHQQSLAQFEKGDTKRSPQWLRFIDQAFEAADQEMAEDVHLTLTAADKPVMIEQLPTWGGAGGGGTGEGDTRLRAFSSSLVREIGARPEDLLLIDVEGDSMEPEFRSGDQILVNRLRRSLAQPGAFCLWDGDSYVVKYVERIMGSEPPRVRILSGNPRYSPAELLADEIRIEGRVVWVGRRV